MPIQNTLIFDQLNKLAQEFELRFEPSIVNGQLLLDITESQKVDGRFLNFTEKVVYNFMLSLCLL